jgi:hypothetical protein
MIALARATSLPRRSKHEGPDMASFASALIQLGDSSR